MPVHLPAAQPPPEQPAQPEPVVARHGLPSPAEPVAAEPEPPPVRPRTVTRTVPTKAGPIKPAKPATGARPVKSAGSRDARAKVARQPAPEPGTAARGDEQVTPETERTPAMKRTPRRQSAAAARTRTTRKTSGE